MAAASSKKRKVDVENRTFKSSWTGDFFVVEHLGNILCLICLETVAVPKEYNIRRHYSSKHASKFDSLVGEARTDRIKSLKQSIAGQQSFFKAANNSSEAATKVSFLIAEAIAKKGKPFSDGQLVKDCLKIFTDVVCPDKKSLVENVSLSHQTLGRRVECLAANIEDALIKRLDACEFYSLALDESTDISDTAQLAIFVRGVTETFAIVEELLDICPMKGTTTGKDVFEEVNRVMEKFKLSKNKLVGVTTDGAPTMMGRHNGCVSLLAQSVPQKIITYHCIIHQENLCAKTLEMKHVMEKVVSAVNFIRSRGLNHREFKSFLEQVGSEHEDVVYFCQVRWLSKANTLSRFWSLRNEVKAFMENKGKDVRFLDDNFWLNDLAFLVDMTKFMADLNVRLQGKDQLVYKLYEHIVTFIQKMKLIQTQLAVKKVVHCTVLSTRPIDTVQHEKYSKLITKLIDSFQQRFQDFAQHANIMKMVTNPFEVDLTGADEKYQLELIDIQNDSELKKSFFELDLLTFYSRYVSPDRYSNLLLDAKRFTALFGSTYCCEQLFSSMNNTKTKRRSLLTDEHLTASLRIATSTVGADIDYLCKQKQCQISH